MSDRPPIEKLSDLAWARVERGLWARVDAGDRVVEPARGRRSLAIAAGVAVAIAAVIAIVVLRRPTSEPIAVVADTAPSRVVSGDAPSSVSFGDAHVELAAQTAIVLTRQDSTALVERGSAWFSVAPRGDRPPFVVLAGDTTVTVVGTRFRVTRDGERAQVEVEHGLVQVDFHGTRTLVGAGQHWSSQLPAVDEVQPAPSPTKPAPPNGRAEFARLTALEVRDPIAAISGYLALSATGGEWAEVALFAAGRLAHERGDHRAETLLSTYLRRFPHGANRADAEQLLAHPGGDHR